MSLGSGLRYSLRMLRLNPGFAAIAIITLALGIGASTAMFSVLDGVVLKPLRYPDADRIVAVKTRFTDSGHTIWRTAGDDVTDLRADKTTFEAFTYYWGNQIGVQLSSGAQFVDTTLTDPDFFHVFAVPTIIGRTFLPEDAGRSAVVSAGFAQRSFGSTRAALGQVIKIETRSYEIVGVMPAVFDFPRATQVWAAMSPIPSVHARTAYNYHAAAKLNRGVSLPVADSQLQAIGKRLAAAFPDSNHDKTFVVASLQDELSAPVRSTVWVLMGAVGLVLLIACANVANLMLARATSRSRELAVRAALGAGRRQLLTQLLSESLVMALAAGVLGLALAAWLTRLLLTLGASFVPSQLLSDIHLDWRVLAFTLLASLLTSILFGVVPAWKATRINLQDALKQGGTRGLLGGGPSGLRSSLVVAQIALSLMLAIGAGLLFRTLLALHDAGLGFQPEGILLTYAHAPARTLAEQLEVGRFFDDLFNRLRKIPGVTAVGGAMGVPTGQYGSNGGYAVEGKQRWAPGEKLPNAIFSLASPGYFSTLGIPLLRGREFNERDQYDSPGVVIISQSIARKWFPTEDPVGHRVFLGLDDRTDKGLTIVGVVGDVRQDSPADSPGPALYMPLRQHPFWANETEIVLRTPGSPERLIPAVQSAIHEMNPDIATKFTTLDASVADSLSGQRFRAALASSFALLALLLALSGMYAVMSYLTARRTSEFGLRSALGAQPGNIVALVLGGAARLALVGIAAGLLLAVLSSRLLSTMLFGLKTTDVSTYVAVCGIVLPVIVLAAALPAWRASRVDAMIALRNE